MTKCQKEALSQWYLYNKGDYKHLRKILSSINWYKEFENCNNIEKMWKIFSSILLAGRDKCVPKMTPSGKYKVRPSWMDKNILEAIKLKHQTYRQWTRNKNNQNYLEYCKKRNVVTAKIRKAVKNYEDALAKDIKTNSRPFWKYIKSKTKYQQEVSYFKIGNIRYINDIDKAQILNETFSKVFVTEDDTNLPLLQTNKIQVPMNKIEITEEQIAIKALLLDEHKAWGPDDIHPKILKECISQLKYPLQQLFMKSLSTGEIPTKWKKS